MMCFCSSQRQNIKIDFNRWKDEDESDDENGGYDDASLEDMMKQMGTGGAGAGAFDPGEMGDSDDSDDEGFFSICLFTLMVLIFAEFFFPKKSLFAGINFRGFLI